MDANIIVEGFQRSLERHGLIYEKFVGDGDSSVYAQIMGRVSYGGIVKKYECANLCF